MTVTFSPSKAVGTVAAPYSKSVLHRALISAALANGVSEISGMNACEDILATVSCLKALGAKITVFDNRITVQGNGFLQAINETALFCRESASTLRFLIPLALLSDQKTVFTGSRSLFARPLGIYESICREQGLLFTKTVNSLTVKGVLSAGEYTVFGDISSQFISGLLFSLPLLNNGSLIRLLPPVKSKAYIDMTIDILNRFGVKIYARSEDTLYIPGAQAYLPLDLQVVGDYSNAAFLEAFQLFGGKVTVTGLNPKSPQGDKIYQKLFALLLNGSPNIELSNCPDLAPILFAVAAAKNGAVFTGTKTLKYKECDRANAMARELKKFGTGVTVFEDSVVIAPCELHKPLMPVWSHKDHRVAMALSVLLSVTGGTLTEAQCVNKSFPGFFDTLKALQVRFYTEEEV